MASVHTDAVQTHKRSPIHPSLASSFLNEELTAVLKRELRRLAKNIYATHIEFANNLPNLDLIHLHDDNILAFDTLINQPTLLTLHGDIKGFWDLKLNLSLKNCKTKLISISQSQKKI